MALVGEFDPRRSVYPFFCSRNGVVRMESMMKMRDKLEKIGMMKRVNQDEKGDPL